MLRRALVASLLIAIAACDQPLQRSPSSPSPSPTPAAPETTTVRVGESVRVTLGATDFVPFDQYGDEKWERVIQVTSSETVTAESRVIVDNGAGLSTVYVGTPDPNIGKNCKYGTRSITCVVPSNGGISIVVDVYPAGSAAVIPTFTFTAQRVES